MVNGAKREYITLDMGQWTKDYSDNSWMDNISGSQMPTINCAFVTGLNWLLPRKDSNEISL